MISRWNRNTVSLVSSVATVIRLPIPWISYGGLNPGASSVNWHWEKMWEADSAPYFTILFGAASLAAERASVIIIIHNTIIIQLHHSMRIILFNAHKYTSQILLGL